MSNLVPNTITRLVTMTDLLLGSHKDPIMDQAYADYAREICASADAQNTASRRREVQTAAVLHQVVGAA